MTLNKPAITLLEAQEQAASKTAPKVTVPSIEAKIATIEYLSPKCHHLLTVCVIRMRNGFTFVGKSAPASPENFDEEIGRRYAYEDAFRQIWSHEGYLLREALWLGEEIRPALERMGR